MKYSKKEDDIVSSVQVTSPESSDATSPEHTTRNGQERNFLSGGDQIRAALARFAQQGAKIITFEASESSGPNAVVVQSAPYTTPDISVRASEQQIASASPQSQRSCGHVVHSQLIPTNAAHLARIDNNQPILFYRAQKRPDDATEQVAIELREGAHPIVLSRSEVGQLTVFYGSQHCSYMQALEAKVMVLSKTKEENKTEIGRLKKRQQVADNVAMSLQERAAKSDSDHKVVVTELTAINKQLAAELAEAQEEIKRLVAYTDDSAYARKVEENSKLAASLKTLSEQVTNLEAEKAKTLSKSKASEEKLLGEKQRLKLRLDKATAATKAAQQAEELAKSERSSLQKKLAAASLKQTSMEQRTVSLQKQLEDHAASKAKWLEEKEKLIAELVKAREVRGTREADEGGQMTEVTEDREVADLVAVAEVEVEEGEEMMDGGEGREGLDPKPNPHLIRPQSLNERSETAEADRQVLLGNEYSALQIQERGLDVLCWAKKQSIGLKEELRVKK